MLVRRDRSLLLVVDIQARLAPAIHEVEPLVGRVGVLLEAARRLAVPVMVSEQYPQGLGATIEPLQPRLEGARFLSKTAFSCADEPLIHAAIAQSGRDQVVLCGTEAHVCVLQSALGFRALGLEVFVVADAVGSRHPESRDLALARLRHEGVVVVNTEMVVFEWLQRAATDEFRAVSPLIK
ncbi:isochorismatase family protein [Geminicoccaceae bacterium 1502E]|nr:isochorismatase family protein [Geminicoccaceae bacterium 1502E]